MAQAYEIKDTYHKNEIIVRLMLIHNKDEATNRHLERLQLLLANNPDETVIGQFCTVAPICWPKCIYDAIARAYQALGDTHPNEILVRQILINHHIDAPKHWSDPDYGPDDGAEMMAQFNRLYELDPQCQWISALTTNHGRLNLLIIVKKLYDAENYVFAHQIASTLLQTSTGIILLEFLLLSAYQTQDRENIIQAHTAQLKHRPSQARNAPELVGFGNDAEIMERERLQHFRAFLRFCDKSRPKNGGFESASSTDDSAAEDMPVEDEIEDEPFEPIVPKLAHAEDSLEESAYQLLATLNPQFSDMSHNIKILMRAATHLDSHDNGEAALRHYDRVIELSPGYIPAYLAKIRLMASLGQNDEIIAFTDRARSNLKSVNVEDDQIVGIVMEAASKLNTYQDGAPAMQCYDDILQISPNYVLAFCEKYRLYVAVNRTDEGVEFISTTLKQLKTGYTVDELVHLLHFISHEKIPIEIHDIAAILATHLADTKVVKQEQRAFVEQMEQEKARTTQEQVSMISQWYQSLLLRLGYSETPPE